MSYLKVKGIVIKELNIGEADKIITIFSRENGKIQAFVKNARRPRSNLSASTQFLCYNDFMLFRGKDMYTVSNCDIIEPFYEIRNDIFRLTYSAHMADLLSDTIQENEPALKILSLFLNTLHFLAKTERSAELLIRIFELKLISLLGYTPQIGNCSACGCEEDFSLYFSMEKHGFICKTCSSNDKTAFAILPGTVKAIRYIIWSDFKQLFNFNLSDEVLDELSNIMRKYIKLVLEKDYNKLDFLKDLKLS
jgi:DNA repair protein RecO (recombination protein O)